jgi:hypothetical protein
MKFLKEIYRILKQIFYLPRYLTNLLFGTFYYDNFLAKSKIKNSGNLPLNKKVVIFLIFPDYGLTKSHLRTLRYFIRNNFTPLVVSNLPLSKEDKDLLLKNCWTLIERKNYGYDFGGYRDGVLFLSEKIRDLDKLILINDSTWFPIINNNSFTDFIDNSSLDFIGATSHYGFKRQRLPSKKTGLLKPQFNFNNKNFHYASYALSFSKKILKDENFLKFWKNLRLSGTKNLVVRRGEIGLTQYIIKNKKYSHGSLINSEELDDILKKLSKETLLKISRETIIEKTSLKKFKEKFTKNADSFSKDELIAFILIQVSKQIIVFSLIKFLIEDLRFPFLKKMLFKLNKSSAEDTYKIIKGLDIDIFDEINSEIKTNEDLSRFLSTN